MYGPRDSDCAWEMSHHPKIPGDNNGEGPQEAYGDSCHVAVDARVPCCNACRVFLLLQPSLRSLLIDMRHTYVYILYQIPGPVVEHYQSHLEYTMVTRILDTLLIPALGPSLLT